MVSKRILKSLLGVTMILFLFSCSNNNNNENADGNDEMEKIKDKENLSKQLEQVFYTLPNPIELAQLLKKANAKYIYELSNPVNNVHKYDTEKSKALNLGIYGADLSYASIYGQTQETMFYLECSQILSDKLGIASSFKEGLVDRIERNINNRDSLLQIISDSFYDTDEFLKTNDRPTTAILILAGGWIEGLYLATQLANIYSNNQDILSRVGEQKYSLNNLIAMMERHQDDSNIATLSSELVKLKAIYDKIPIKYQSEVESNNNQDNSIGLIAVIDVNKQNLKQISDKISTIRKNIIE